MSKLMNNTKRACFKCLSAPFRRAAPRLYTNLELAISSLIHVTYEQDENGHLEQNQKNLKLATLSKNPSIYVTKETPACAVGGKTYCENDEEYDVIARPRILEILKKHSSNKKLYPSILKPQKTKNSMPSSLQKRSIDNTYNSCTSRQYYIYPRRALSDTNEWVFLVNVDGMVQQLQVEICENYGKSCGINRTTNEESVCQQQLTYRKIIVLSGDGKTLVETNALFPSFCSCYKE